MELVADVKCYFCGHISGQISGPRDSALKISAFVPRPGYTKPAPQPGDRLRCERCNGPVYLEDVSPLSFGKGKVAVLRRKTLKPKPRQAA